MSDQQFLTPTAGEADWDTSLNADFTTLERGFYVTERAGIAVTTGQVLWLNSGGYFFPFAAASASIYPTAMAFTAASSGDSLRALAWGIVRSLGINSLAVPGKILYVSSSTPGLVVGSYAGASRPIGVGLLGNGVLFNPDRVVGGSGITAIAQASDVNTNGVSDGKVLTWSDASSIWVPSVPSVGSGGGGVTIGTWPSVVQTFASSTTAGSLGHSFTSTPTTGNMLMFICITNKFLNIAVPMASELFFQEDFASGLNDGQITVHYLLADGTKTFGFGNSDGDNMSLWGAEILNWGRLEAKGSRCAQSPNVASGGSVGAPAATSQFGKSLAFSVVTDHLDIASSTIAAGNVAWTIQKALVGNTFGGHGVIAMANSPIGANSFSIPVWTLQQSAAVNNIKGLATIMIHPKLT